MINVNGCVHCGVLWRSHGSRYDSLHPAGIVEYVAPDNELRKTRVRANRAERERK